MARPVATISLDAQAFDTLVSQAHRLDELLPPRRTLTPARVLVLAMLCVSPSRQAIRDTARALRSTSRFGGHLQRVHVHARLWRILRDLEDMGLIHHRLCMQGHRIYALYASVHRSMEACLRDATEHARSPCASPSSLSMLDRRKRR